MSKFAAYFGRLLSTRRDGDLSRAAPRDAPDADDSSPATHIEAGNARLRDGDLDGASRAYHAAALADPTCADAHLNLGFVLLEQGNARQAVAALARSIELRSDSSDAHFVIGRAWQRLSDIAQAIFHLQIAVDLRADFLAARLELAKALADTGQYRRAEDTLRAALALDAGSADLHGLLGNVLAAESRLSEALACYRHALRLDARHAQVLGNMALVLSELCEHDEAIASSHRALEIDPTLHHVRSNLLLALSRHPGRWGAEYRQEALAYARAVTPSVMPPPPPDIDRRGRPLRVGFVSGDLRSHPVGYFLESVLAHWNRADMAVLVYSNHSSSDDLTDRLRPLADGWRDVAALHDLVLLQRIRDDGIDVLIDLSGHTAGNRLPLFAHRPAPLQVSWLGYWASTGLPTIDWVIGDPVSVPSTSDAQFTESVWRLPHTRLCFSAPAADVPAVQPLPAARSGTVTFGSFQNLMKLNDGVLRLWSRVLLAVPDSRLRLQAPQLKEEAQRESLLGRLAKAGIDAARVSLVGPGTRLEYLAAHAEVDILLDTFPQTGGTTTCEALWMGVPTITLAGQTMLLRQGASLLTCAGLADWVADNDDAYVALAIRRSADLAGLATLRTRMRSQVEVSPLLDAPRFAAELQAALRSMWRTRGLGEQSQARERPTAFD